MRAIAVTTLLLASVVLGVTLATVPVVADHEDAVRIVAVLHGDAGSPYPNASGTAVFGRASDGWNFTVTVQDLNPSEGFVAIYYQLNPPSIGGSFTLCTLTTDGTGEGSCSGHVDELPEPDEIGVLFVDQEGTPLGAARDRGDFTFEGATPAATPPALLPVTGVGAGAKSLNPQSLIASLIVAAVVVTGSGFLILGTSTKR